MEEPTQPAASCLQCQRTFCGSLCFLGPPAGQRQPQRRVISKAVFQSPRGVSDLKPAPQVLQGKEIRNAQGTVSSAVHGRERRACPVVAPESKAGKGPRATTVSLSQQNLQYNLSFADAWGKSAVSGEFCEACCQEGLG